MQAFFKAPLVRAVLGLLALILVSLAIWYIGPLLAFGDMRPLGSVVLRVSAIGLLLVLIVLMLLRWSVSVVGVTCLCVLIWSAGPLLAFGGAVPLADEGMRWLVIFLVVLVYGVWGLYTLWNLMRNDKEFADRLLKRDKNAPKILARQEIRAINALARKAVNQLKEMHMTVAGGTGSFVSGLRRLVEGKRYLYDLPWFMIIGTPGAGKTSVLLNSGLTFPVAEQMGVASAQMTLSKNLGTGNCVWWFTNDAVLIDTAGRYTNPDDGLLLSPKPATQVEAQADGQVASDDKKKVSVEAPPAPEAVNRAEWLGFLNILRNVRPRAPINGALLAVDVSRLLQDDDAQLLAHAAQLRARLGELRQELSIRFPVYVVLTKTDVLKGFADYFSSLTTEARSQVWGFTLPWKEQDRRVKSAKKRTAAAESAPSAQGVNADWPLAQQVTFEMEALQRRLADGVAVRLQEEFELDRRQALYVLPQEMMAIAPRLAKLLDAVFSDSRYDTTQLTHTLRGVYLTSVMQYEDKTVNADATALIPRLKRALTALAGRMGSRAEEPSRFSGDGPDRATSTRSYFVTDAMKRVMFAEAHLVKPNLKWEARFRLFRLMGHALVIVVFIWMVGGLLLSHANNQAYLQDVDAKTKVLSAQMDQLNGKVSLSQSTYVLTLAQALPTHSGLDLLNPSSTFGFGLYSAEPVLHAAELTYGNLQDRVILPVLVQRMEFVLRDAVNNEDSKTAYETLRVYLLMHDLAHYRSTPSAAQDLRNWVFSDWQDSTGNDTDASAELRANQNPMLSQGPVLLNSAGIASGKLLNSKGLAFRLGNTAAMIGHLESMFSGRRVVQAASARNEALIRQVRDFLDTSSRSERLYERAKASLKPEAPQDFTLVRVLGPQAGTLFRRASGNTLENGVSGLFTYDGYHNVFSKRLPDMVAVAQIEDAWVMGRDQSGQDVSEKKSQEMMAASKAESLALTDDIRRQYLGEYADLWRDFLDDIRVIEAEGGGSLSFELNVLRQFAAPDSPLVRLGRLAARETTLSRSLQVRSEEEKSIFEKANDQLLQKTASASQNMGMMRPEQRAERLLVDARFSALREVVTGQSEGAVAQGGKPALESITGALNDYYTLLVVADSAISAGSLPPAGAEAATRLRIEASKLPAPFHEVLLGVSASGLSQISNAAISILKVQAQAQMDRLVGMLALSVGEPCRRNIAGRYPFSASTQEVIADDFNAMFAAGGVADEYFNKFLMPLVDTSVRPWRYKNPSSVNMMVGTEGMANGQTPAATINGPTLMGELLKLLAQSGPNPDSFAQVSQIREAFFREPGAKRLAWKFDMTVQVLDPSVTELLIDIDGQNQRYAHGPLQPLSIQWPGPRGGTMAEITAFPRIKADTSTASARGPWAVLRLIEKGKIISSATTGQVAVEFLFDNRRTVINFAGAGTALLTGNLLKNFSCPGSRAV